METPIPAPERTAPNYARPSPFEPSPQPRRKTRTERVMDGAAVMVGAVLLVLAGALAMGNYVQRQAEEASRALAVQGVADRYVSAELAQAGAHEYTRYISEPQDGPDGAQTVRVAAWSVQADALGSVYLVTVKDGQAVKAERQP